MDDEFGRYEQATERILEEWGTLGDFMDTIGGYLMTKKALAEAESRVKVTEGMAETYLSRDWMAAVPHERAGLAAATKAHTESFFAAVDAWKRLNAAGAAPSPTSAAARPDPPGSPTAAGSGDPGAGLIGDDR